MILQHSESKRNKKQFKWLTILHFDALMSGDCCHNLFIDFLINALKDTLNNFQ